MAAPKSEVADATITEGICELTLQTPAPRELAAFYRDAFGWPLLSEAGDRVWLACGDRARLGLWSPGRKEFGDRGGLHVHFALSVRPERLDPLADHLREMGVEVQGPVEHEGGDRSIYFEDPEGNVVESWSFFEAGDGARTGVDSLA